MPAHGSLVPGRAERACDTDGLLRDAPAAPAGYPRRLQPHSRAEGRKSRHLLLRAGAGLAGELDAGQPSRVRLPAATVAHGIGIRRFVEWIFMCTSPVFALEPS